MNTGLYNASFARHSTLTWNASLRVSSMVFERATEFPTTEDHIAIRRFLILHTASPKAGGGGLLPRSPRGARAALHDLPSLHAYGAGEIPEDERASRTWFLT